MAKPLEIILLKTMASGFMVKVLAASCAFIFDLLIARYLGSSQAGYFFLAQAIVIVFASIVRQGFDNAIVRFIATYKRLGQQAELHGLMTYTLWRVALVGIISAAVLFLSAKPLSLYVFHKGELCFPLRIFALALLPLSLTQTIGYFFQGHSKVITGMLYQSSLLLFLGVGAIVLWHPHSAILASKLYLGCVCSIACIAIVHSWCAFDFQKTVYSRKERISLNRTLISLFLILVIGQLAQWSAPIALGLWMPSHIVAWFTAALKTAKLTSFMLIIVNAVTAPMFAEAFASHDMAEIRRVAKQSSRLMFAAAVPLLLGVLAFAPYIMQSFGKDFIQAANILRILALGQFVNAITGAVGYVLQMTGHEIYLRNSMILSFMLLIILLAILTPWLGMYGAAIAVAVAMAAENLWCTYQVRRLFGINMLSIRHLI